MPQRFRLLLRLLCLGVPLAAAESPLESIADYSWGPLGDTSSWVTGRLSAKNRTLLIDGKPIILRGVTYSPAPIGKDMSAQKVEDRIEDFFIPAHRKIWQRDLPLMARMGMNAVRVYELKRTGDHTEFLDLCYALNLTVLAGFPLHNAIHDLLDTGGPNAVMHMDDLSREVRRAAAASPPPRRRSARPPPPRPRHRIFLSLLPSSARRRR